ncbi:MAG TPA: thiamine-phosphate kinase [Burkholderiales bacterium]|nr:thiamine-phosphate kinase [Burkholderiales bacterium]
MPSEFDLIAKYFTRPARRAVLGVGDDAALLAVQPGCELAVSADMLVEGVHFFPDVDAQALGHKALAVNLSDMAAMGAMPRWALLALALPRVDATWLDAFSHGFFALADKHGVDLVGGDTTRGPLALCVQILGEVERGKALRRDGARAGDDIWVSGELGAAAAAIAHRRGELVLAPQALQRCRERLDRPAPRVALGLELAGLASSAIDVSDGLLADLGHVCERSHVGARVSREAVPCAADLQALRGQPAVERAVLAGGDDYELCFTAAPEHAGEIAALGAGLELALTRIGAIVEGGAVALVDAAGRELAVEEAGFDHFR